MSLSEYASKFFELADMLRDIRGQARDYADKLRRAGPAKYKGVTVSRVRRHRVRAHWREEHVRVRA